MGIGDWFGFGKKKAPEPIIEVPAVPTSESLVAALDAVEAMAAAGRVPPMVMARLKRVTTIVRQTIPRMGNLGGGSASAYNVMATATDYLPGAIGGYLRLPRDWADTRPVDRGKTSLLILIDQLDLLGATMDKVYDAVNRADAEALVVHGRFLQEKFGSPSGGDLGLGAGALTSPMPPGPSGSSGAPLTPPAPSAVRAPAAPPPGDDWLIPDQDPDTGDIPHLPQTAASPPAPTQPTSPTPPTTGPGFPGRLMPPTGRDA